MTRTWESYFMTFAVMMVGLIVFLAIAFTVFILPLAAFNTIRLKRLKRKLFTLLNLPGKYLHGAHQLAVLYASDRNSAILCLNAGQFMCFINNFDLTAFRVNYPEWLGNELSEAKGKNRAIIASAVLFKQITKHFRKLEPNPEIVVLTNDDDFVYWFNQDSASEHFQSSVNNAQRVVRTFIGKEIRVEKSSAPLNYDELKDIVGSIQDLHKINLMRVKEKIFKIFA